MAKDSPISDIKKEIQKKMKNATINTYNEASEILDDSFDIFYSQGNPKYYSAGTGKRTYTLPNAKYAPKPIIMNDSSYMELGYDGGQISYNTGTFTGGEVLGATMTGTYGVLGDKDYDNIAFEDIPKAMKKHFDAEFGNI